MTDEQIKKTLAVIEKKTGYSGLFVHAGTVLKRLRGSRCGCLCAVNSAYWKECEKEAQS